MASFARVPYALAKVNHNSDVKVILLCVIHPVKHDRNDVLNLPTPIPNKEKKILIFKILWGASKVSMKAFKAFVKPFEAPKRGVKINIQVNFYFNTTFEKAR